MWHFSRDIRSLSHCIENDDVFKNIDQHSKNLKIVKTIALLAAQKFSRSIKEKNEIQQEVTDVIENLQREIAISSTWKIPWELLETNTIQAIMDCSDEYEDMKDKIKTSNDVPNVSSKPTVLPEYKDSFYEVSDLLNYILVDWSEPLAEMSQTRNGRSLLRRYANDALKRLVSALNSLDDYRILRSLLLETWIRRAKNYFDGRDDSQISYIGHHYTIDGALLANGDINSFYYRRYENFADRNPPASDQNINEIIRIHDRDRPHDGGEGIFSEYEQDGMTRAHYYFERHLKQFFRILLYVLELRVSGIWTDVDDNYDGPLPYEIAFETIQRILYDDEVYKEVLLARRDCVLENLKRLQIKNEPTLSSNQIKEEYLIIWLRIMIKNIRSSLSIINNIPSTETAENNPEVVDCLQNENTGGGRSNNNGEAHGNTIAATPKNEEIKNAEGVCVSDNEKQSTECRSETLTERQQTRNSGNQLSTADYLEFELESGDLSLTLDLILVDFESSVEDMIHSRAGRVLLRRFANDALSLLDSVLDDFDFNTEFRRQLRDLWMIRAEQSFDARNPQLPYIFRGRLNTHDYINLLQSRSTQDFRLRNPPASPEDIDRILRIYLPEGQTQHVEGSIFAEYERNGMSSAELYFERHLLQFYRIILFFVELQSRGVSTDESDFYNGVLPNEVIPSVIQSIVYNDENYRKYLIRKKKSLIEIMKNIPIESNPNSHIGEEALIEYFRDSCIDFVYESSTSFVSTTSTSTTTSTTRTSSTTSKYQKHGKNKNEVCLKKYKNKNKQSAKENKKLKKEQKKQNKKNNNKTTDHFKLSVLADESSVLLKLLRVGWIEWIHRASSRVCASDNKKQISYRAGTPITGKKEQKQNMKNNGAYHGYIIYNGNPNQLLFPQPESSTFMKMVRGIFAPFGGSRMLHQDLRR